MPFADSPQRVAYLDQRYAEIEEHKRSKTLIIDNREVMATKHRPMSPSSQGSVETLTAKRPNPLIKAVATQRKDFNFVTNLRREVIEIVEPYRSKVIDYERRF